GKDVRANSRVETGSADIVSATSRRLVNFRASRSRQCVARFGQTFIMSEPTFNRRREEFPTLTTGIHLLSHSLGPVPRAARGSMLDYCDAWERHTSEDAWATSWWELSQRVGDRLAHILGGTPGSVQITPNASIALSNVASCFDFAATTRNKGVISALAFPSMAC